MALTLGTNSGFVTTAPSADPVATNARIDNRVAAFRHTSPSDAIKVVEMGWYCDNQNDEGQNFEVGLYTHDSGNDKPDDLVVGSDKTNTLSSGAGWKAVTGLDITISGSTVYWLAIQVDDSSVDTDYNYTLSGGNKFAFKKL